MKVKLTFDNTVPVDDLPNPITVTTEVLEDAFADLCNELNSIDFEFNRPPVESVKILGKGGRDVTDEFNEFWEEY